jgi:hypothetical protein
VVLTLIREHGRLALLSHKEEAFLSGFDLRDQQEVDDLANWPVHQDGSRDASALARSFGWAELVRVGEGIGVDVQAFHLVAVDGVLHASLALSALSLGNDLLVRHGKLLSLLHSTRQGLRVQWYRNHHVVLLARP